MTYARAAVLAVAVVAALSAQAEPIDRAAILKIRDEALNRSHVDDTLFWLTDRYGPRLHGSPEFEEAGDWAVKQLQTWGLTNVQKERFPSGPGWSLVRFNASMVDPRVMPIIGVPKARSPGTSGRVTAEVVRPLISSPADVERYLARAVEIEPRNPESITRLGLAKAQNGQMAEAAALFRRALSVQPGYEPAQRALARVPASSQRD